MGAMKIDDPINEVCLDIEWAAEGWPEEISITALSIVLARCILNSKNYVNAFDHSTKIILNSLNDKTIKRRTNGG